eukprot:TRINITY_DN39086_c0_g1_i1.p1 TRINITY_DN39086_c0_g1~~TRINITY_DN39086_c0_g1_i1.p1  ORF type:complete len:366 (+),score=123.83 TRINITY_DN39086_c0_g1_i1:70-1167(+)
MKGARAMLDALMGPNRDKAPGETKQEDWRDRKVCKKFLIGFCPYDKAVLGGRRSIEPCSKIHNEMLREAFNGHADGSPDSSYRRDCEDIALRDLAEAINIKDIYAKEQLSIKAAELKIRRTGPNHEIGRMKREAMLLKEQADALTDDSDGMKKEQLMKQHETAMADYEAFVKEVEKKEEQNAPKAQSCKVCGTAYGSEDEYKAHLERRMHQAYTQIQEKHDELLRKKDERQKKAVEEAAEKRAKREEKKKKDDKDKDDGEKKDEKKKKDDQEKEDGEKKKKEDKEDGEKKKKEDKSKEDGEKKKDDDKKKEDSKKKDSEKKKGDDERSRSKGRKRSRSRSRGRGKRSRSRSKGRRRSRSRSRRRR